MEQRNCGKSGIKLSSLGLGCWAFGGGDYWGESDQKNVTRLVQRAVELGINYFDTAEGYNKGRSESFLGDALKSIPRDQVVIGTKVSPTNLKPATLIEHCETSLQHLGLDYVDFYMIHWPLHSSFFKNLAADESAPSLSEAVETLLKLQEQGKIRHLGLSNFGVTKCEEIRGLGGQYAVNQLGYNLLFRAAEREIFPYCREHGIGTIAYMVLMQGLLTDRFASFDDMPHHFKRTRQFNSNQSPQSRHGEEGAEAETRQALDDIRGIAEECNISMADIALKWTVAKQDVTCALVGTQNVQRLEANVKAIEEPLPSEIVERLDTATQPLKAKMGLSLDLFEHTDNDRTK